MGRHLKSLAKKTGQGLDRPAAALELAGRMGWVNR
jgi:hypothetical protein